MKWQESGCKIARKHGYEKNHCLLMNDTTVAGDSGDGRFVKWRKNNVKNAKIVLNTNVNIYLCRQNET
jgi:hypothetical protein